MKRHTPQSIGEVLRNLLEESSLQNRMDELNAVNLWSGIVGNEIASLSSRPQVKKGVMYVGVPNAALRNELNMSRSRIQEIINSKIGKPVITEIRFTS